MNFKDLPSDNIEYVYLHDMAWFADDDMKKANGYRSISMNRGTIMTDVIKVGNSYEFTWKVTGIRLHTNYAWSLAENSPENVKHIENYDKSKKELKQKEKNCNVLYNRIITLSTEFEVDDVGVEK